MPSTVAVYVHFPYCLSICPYCDFDRQATGFDRIDAYLEAVRAELASCAPLPGDVHSVFFGGGTPSLMQPEQVAAVLDAIRRAAPASPGAAAPLASAEVTLEANPGDANPEKLAGFRAAGVTRLSVGAQSFDDRFLELLGRRHSAEAIRETAGWARQAGLALSLDLMYGLPDQSPAHWADTLESALQLGPDHLSCYLLTVDERVPLGRDVARGRLTLPEDDDLADMYEHTRVRLARAGFEQYEVSNWARPGQASRHNLTYWRDDSWLGVGAGAASSLAGKRWKNTPVVERYIQSVQATGGAARTEDERPDLPTALFDYLSLGLRLREGVSAQRFARRFGADLLEVLGEEGAWLVEHGVLEHNGTGKDRGLRVAGERQFLLNEVLARLREPVTTWGQRREDGRSTMPADQLVAERGEVVASRLAG